MSEISRIKKFEEIRKHEYPQINSVYLDNAAAPIPPRAIYTQCAIELADLTLVNPHSKGPFSNKTNELLCSVKQKVLKLLNADPFEYSLVFTANATAAMKLVGECMQKAKFVYLRDAHTSMVGLRALAQEYVTVDDVGVAVALGTIGTNTVAGWPLQSNFDGRIYPGESWTRMVREAGALSLVDIATYCSTKMPSLTKLQADFLVLSFYKIFGLPDLGALLIRRSAETEAFVQKRRYFGGGTVTALTAEQDFMVRGPSFEQQLQDGTPPIHSIAVLGIAIDQFERIFTSFETISQHTAAIARYCRDELETTQCCRVLSPKHSEPIVTFMLLRGGHNEFVTVASELCNIHVRVGSLCNVGAFGDACGIPDQQIISNYREHGKKCNDETDAIDGQALGVIRASFGPYSTKADVDALVQCVTQYFGNSAPIADSTILTSPQTLGAVVDLVVYPIKSCGGVHVTSSAVTSAGLKWDRQFCLIDAASFRTLSLKNHHRMACLKATVYESLDILRIQCEGGSIDVPLYQEKWRQKLYAKNGGPCAEPEADICVNQNRQVQAFLSAAVGTPCTLAKSVGGGDERTLANASPLLIISLSSARAIGVDYRVFRANVVLSGSSGPWMEDHVQALSIGEVNYQLTGRCRRCNMICVTDSGKSDSFPYNQLWKYRRENQRIWFGRHAKPVFMPQLGFDTLDRCSNPAITHSTINVGDEALCIAAVDEKGN